MSPLREATAFKYTSTVVRAAREGYEVEIGWALQRNTSSYTMPLYAFTYRKSWPCEDGIYEQPLYGYTYVWGTELRYLLYIYI